MTEKIGAGPQADPNNTALTAENTAPAAFNEAMTREWLQLLHGNSPGRIQIASTTAWSGPSYPTEDVDAAVARVAELDAGRPLGVYVRMTTLRARLERGSRGGVTDSLALPGLWADIDIASPAHKDQNLPPDWDAAEQVIGATELPCPSLWVDSGHGAYPVWLLEVPHVLSDDDFADVADLSANWQRAIAAGSAKLGWHYGTGVGDLARVLRIPGTVNRKAGTERLCRIVPESVTDDRYTLAELLEYCADAMAAIEPERRAPYTPPNVSTRTAVPGELTPWEDYAARTTWAEILLPHGWQLDHQRNGTEYWCRPGKEPGSGQHSATINALGTDRLHIFSTSTDFEPGSYGKLGALAVLEHGGRIEAASAALSAQGFGSNAAADAKVQEWMDTLDEAPPRAPVAPVANSATAQNPPARRLVLTAASEIEPEPVVWAWKDDQAQPEDAGGRIPMGSLSIAAGREGTGKSSFGIWLAAHITRGTLPGALFGKPRCVIYAAVEDSWKYTLVPRLMAAGADRTKVFRVEVVQNEQQGVMLSLPADNSLLRKAILDTGTALLVLDPLMSTIGAGIDTHRERDVRTALDPLARLADETHCVVLGIAHFNKGGGTDPSSLITGSGAFKNVPRSVFGFAQDPEGGRVMSQTKNSLGRLDLPSLSYEIESTDVATKTGTAHVGHLVWGGESDRTVTDILSDRDDGDERAERDEAAEWLRTYLADQGGEAAFKDLVKAARADGLAEHTVRRARARAGVEISRVGFPSTSVWRLQSEHSADSPDRVSKPVTTVSTVSGLGDDLSPGRHANGTPPPPSGVWLGSGQPVACRSTATADGGTSW